MATDWMTGFSGPPGLIEKYAATTGAVLGGRVGFSVHPDAGGIYGGAWQGPVFVLTHHPGTVRPAPGVTFLSCDVAEAVRIGLFDDPGGAPVRLERLDDDPGAVADVRCRPVRPG